MPRTTRDELTGDFLGLGYSQRMRAEGSSLNIYDPPDRGGELKQSEPLDLVPAPDSVNFIDDQNNAYDLNTYAQYASYAGGNQCAGCFGALFNHTTSTRFTSPPRAAICSSPAPTAVPGTANPDNPQPDDG